MIFGATPICILMATIGAGGIRSEAPSVNRYITKLQDLAATVEVTRLESSELEKIGRDFAPMYRLKHLSLLYKNPDLMRLDGSSACSVLAPSF